MHKICIKHADLSKIIFASVDRVTSLGHPKYTFEKHAILHHVQFRLELVWTKHSSVETLLKNLLA